MKMSTAMRQLGVLKLAAVMANAIRFNGRRPEGGQAGAHEKYNAKPHLTGDFYRTHAHDTETEIRRGPSRHETRAYLDGLAHPAPQGSLGLPTKGRGARKRAAKRLEALAKGTTTHGEAA